MRQTNNVCMCVDAGGLQQVPTVHPLSITIPIDVLMLQWMRGDSGKNGCGGVALLADGRFGRHSSTDSAVRTLQSRPLAEVIWV